eukprot:TRINITY_DN1052_c0_g1_i1.p1 TRINITY_DN1052_c0_g1~~TRINITY_DN1052_c0_g1_i1.p1  ORF type:complete len:438 (-),score=48.20 TRINITY_DN1052_c0_g1_i1:110-1423(-)
MKLGIVCLLTLLIGCLSQEFGFKVFVSNNGTDEQSCGYSTKPCRTIKYAVDYLLTLSELTIGEIVIEAGVYSGIGNSNISLFVEASPNIILSSSSGEVIIDCDNKTQAFRITPATFLGARVDFEGITFRNCGNPSIDYGGAIFATVSTVTLTNCTFINCNAKNGGAIAFSTLETGYPSFIHIKADGYGGSLMFRGARLEILNSTFIDNKAQTGGAISILSGESKLINTSFNFNNASVGGAFFLGNNTVSTMLQNTFHGNSAHYGGGIYTMNAIIDVLESSLHNNTATSNGSAIYCKNSISSWNGTLMTEVQNLTYSNLLACISCRQCVPCQCVSSQNCDKNDATTLHFVNYLEPKSCSCYSTSPIPCEDGHGTCFTNGSAVCKCTSGWTGSNCSAKEFSIASIIVFTIVICALAIIGIIFLSISFYRKKKMGTVERE